MSTVLLVCHANTCRSVMAHVLLEKMLAARGTNGAVRVRSGGIANHARDGMIPSLDARIVLREDDIHLTETAFASTDLRRHRDVVAGAHLIVTMTQQKFIGLDAATGRLLWERPYATEYAQNIITPVRYGDTLIVSGYQKPVVAFRVTRRNDQWNTEQVWENADISLYMSDAVLAGETLVGFSQRRSGQFFGLDARSGKTLWTSDARQGTNAAIVTAGDFWLALKDNGELLVLRKDGTRFEPLRRYEVAKSATWAQPVVSGNRVFVKDVSTLTLWTLD